MENAISCRKIVFIRESLQQVPIPFTDSFTDQLMLKFWESFLDKLMAKFFALFFAHSELSPLTINSM